MENLFGLFVEQLQQPVLAFLLVGMAASAVNSSLRIPGAIYQFCIFMLLMKIGLSGGMAIRDGNIVEMLLPIFFSTLIGVGIAFLGSVTLARLPGIKKDDALATAGLFGAVSASTLAAGMIALETGGIFFEGWLAALYPFMDIPALITAVVLANVRLATEQNGGGPKVKIGPIIKDSLRGTGPTVLVMGMVLGLLAKPDSVYESFFDPLFRGFLSILMLTFGMEASGRLKELKGSVHWYVAYALLGPLRPRISLG